jgi:hypothetical protein
LTFAVPVTITLGHSDTGSAALSVFRLDDELDTTWDELAGAAFGATTVTFEATSFSVLCPGGSLGPAGPAVDQFGTTSTEAVNRLAMDGDDAVLVGNTLGSLDGGSTDGTWDAFARRIDVTTGTEWTHQVRSNVGDEHARGVATDGTGTTVMSGDTTAVVGAASAGGIDAFVRMLDATGAEVWTHQFGTNASDNANGGIALDGSDVLVVGGTGGTLGASSAGGGDVYVRRLDAAGTELWTTQLGSPDHDNPYGMDVDASGNTLVAGTTTGDLAGPNAGGYDGFLTKLDPTGSVLWTVQFGTALEDCIWDVAADGSGNAIVAGFTSTTCLDFAAGDVQGSVRKFDPNGVELWSYDFGGPLEDRAFGVATDAAGDILVVGRTTGDLSGTNLGGWDLFVHAVDAAGNPGWTEQLGSVSDDSALDVGLDSRGGGVVGGQTYGTVGAASAGGWDGLAIWLEP